MGNCFHSMQSLHKKSNVLVTYGGEEKFKASTKVGNLISGSYEGCDLVHFGQPNLPLPLNKRLLPAEGYIHMPRKYKISLEVVELFGYTEPQKVKIVVTRKQLEFLVRNAEDFQVKEISPISSWKRNEDKKWKPCLVTIQE